MTKPETHRILVVDDNEAGRYALARVLRRAGFETLEAGTGAEALSRVNRDHPDLVLLDVGLPDMSGVQVSQRIKASPATRSTTVLQISASAVDASSQVAALEGGADGYITSPIEPAVLVATIRAMLRARTAEKALQEAVREWQATFNAIQDGVALVDAEGRLQRYNAGLMELLGSNGADIHGRKLDELIRPAAGEQSLFQALEGLRRTTLERTTSERSFNITVDPMLTESQTQDGGVAIVTDVSESKRIDQQLRHSQKLESIGLLAGGVAHDFNNLLMGILGNTSLALDSLDDPEQAAQLLQDVVRASERAADLTRQLLAYAGKGRFITGRIDLSSVIQEMLPLIQASIPRKVDLQLRLGRDLPTIQADKAQIEQLVMNLLINAGEAIGNDGGKVEVSTGVRNVSVDELADYFSETNQESDFVFLRVTDTGCGMDEETVKRIFDPFYTTKFLGRGLGLSATLGIVRGHKGAIKVTSAPSAGAEFEVLFPAIANRPEPQTLKTEDAPARGNGAVLVVDDEEIVRKVLQQILARAGYEVLVAENGAEAIRIFAKNAKRICLVVLDLVMPVMSGKEALPHLLTMKPGIPIIVSSGQSEGECMRELQEPRIAAFLQKPYRPSTFAAKVQEVMENAGKEQGVRA